MSKRIRIETVVQSDITVADWIKLLPSAALHRIVAKAKDENIRMLAMAERDAREASALRSAS